MLLRTRLIQEREYVFCPWRHKWVRLTPEERVRQTYLQYIVSECDYPASRIAVEAALPSGQRSDAIVYDEQLHPIVLLEFKAPSVPLTEKTLDQAAVYNRMLHVPWLVLHNGEQTIVAFVEEKQIRFLPYLPAYGDTH